MTEEKKAIGNCQCGLPLNTHHDREGELWLACPKHGRLTEDIPEQTAPTKPEPSLKRDMEGLVRIANRYGFLMEGHLSDGHRILRRSDGESLELLLEEA